MAARNYAEQAKRWDAANKRSAELIVAEPHRYGGPGSGPVIWAYAVLRKLRDEQQAVHRRPVEVGTR